MHFNYLAIPAIPAIPARAIPYTLLIMRVRGIPSPPFLGCDLRPTRVSGIAWVVLLPEPSCRPSPSAFDQRLEIWLAAPSRAQRPRQAWASLGLTCQRCRARPAVERAGTGRCR